MIQVSNLGRLRNLSWLVGIVLAALSVVGFLANRSDFFQSYLVGILWWFGIGIGCLGVWQIHNLVGGQWGDVIGRHIRAGADTLFIFPIFFVPIVLGMSVLYPWTHPGFMEAHEQTMRQVWYLNTRGFIIRAIVLFALWILMVIKMKRVSTPQAGIEGTEARRSMQRWSSVSLLTLSLMVTVMSVDWVMSIEPRYYSTIYGIIILMGEMLSAFAFVAMMAIISPEGSKRFALEPRRLQDVASLLMMSVMLWMYMTFSQYLLTWSGQLPEEVQYYNYRFMGGWEWVGLVLLFIGFFLPFFLLLFRYIKKQAKYLFWVAVILLAMRWVDMYWMVSPNFYPMHLHLSWMNFVIPLAIGAIWFALYISFYLRTDMGFARGHQWKVTDYDA